MRQPPFVGQRLPGPSPKCARRGTRSCTDATHLLRFPPALSAAAAELPVAAACRSLPPIRLAPETAAVVSQRWLPEDGEEEWNVYWATVGTVRQVRSPVAPAPSTLHAAEVSAVSETSAAPSSLSPTRSSRLIPGSSCSPTSGSTTSRTTWSSPGKTSS